MASYIFRTCIYPAVRETYDHKPVDLSTGNEPDEDWMEYPKGVTPKDVVLTPLSLMDLFGRGIVLAIGKLICPIWSPYVKMA